jgi:hypothetical protein
MRNIEFDVGEVLAYDYTYQHIPSDKQNSTVNSLFSLKVRSCSRYYNNEEFIVKPSSINLKQIPLVGEFVLIYKTFNQQSTSTKWREQWYYVTSIDIHSSINENMLPGLSDGLTQSEIDQIKPGYTFKQKSISPLQPYEGDFLLEGRWGNSIRFSSTVNYEQGKYSNLGNWRGNADGDPIIVISNGRQNKPNKQFVVEDINLDDASVYLTSTQTVPTLQLGDKNSPNSLSCFLPNESQFAKSQFIGTADRVIIKAKTDVVVIDSPKAIILNTTGEIKLGNDEASSNMVHGDVLLNVMQKILNQLSSPIQCGTMVGTFVDRSNIAAAQQELKNLLSQKYYLTK